MVVAAECVTRSVDSNGSRSANCMEAGASTRTSTGGVLDAVPLPVGLRDRCVEMAPVAGLAPARTRLKGEALGSLHSRAFDEMAERGGHAPHHAKCATISLAKNARAAAPPQNAERQMHSRRSGNPGSLVRFTFQWCPRRERPARKRHLQTRSGNCVAAGAAIALALSEV